MEEKLGTNGLTDRISSKLFFSNDVCGEENVCLALNASCDYVNMNVATMFTVCCSLGLEPKIL